MRPSSDPDSDREDLRAQFLIAVGDLCIAAEVGRLVVELRFGTGERTVGVPVAVRRQAPPVAGEDRTDAPSFEISGHAVDLRDVVACTIHAPGAGFGGRSPVAVP